MITLRPYQIEARDAILKEWASGRRSTFAFLCTGAGKTEIALSVLAHELSCTPDARLLAIAHRDELITQPRDRIIAHWSHALPVPGIVKGGQNDCAHEFIVATIQTVYKENRIRDILEYGAITHLWIDESHRGAAPMYKALIAFLTEANPSIRIFGVTATPIRTDKVGLGTIFESCAYRFPIDRGIKEGALVPFTGIGIELPVDFSEVSESSGDSGWDDEKAGAILSLANAEEVIVQSWLKHASDRQTIAFTSSVSQAYSLARAFRAAGVKAEAIDGDKKTTPDERRARVLGDFRNKELQMIVNVQIMTEGVDIPETSCILMAKPTKSDLTYTQAVGRGLRLFPGKKNCMILDFAPRNARNMRMAGDLLGKPREVKKIEEKARDKGVLLDCFGIGADGLIEGDPDSVQTKILDYLGSSHLAWTFDGKVSTVSIGPSLSLVVVAPQQERIQKAESLRDSPGWGKKHDDLLRQVSSYQVFAVERSSLTPLGTETDWQAANYLATDYAETHGEDVLSTRSKKWRKNPASDKQRQMCKNLGVWREDMRSGEAAQAITHALALRALTKRGVLK